MGNLKIAVTGGSGFIGGHLVQRLASEDYEVKALVRKTSNITFLKKLGVEIIYGDLSNKKSLEKLIDNVDIIYHVAAKVYHGSKDEFWEVNFQGTLNILEACLNKSIDRFVYTSSIGVMGSIKNPPADESYPYNPLSPYDRSKCEAEKIVLQYHQEYDMPVTIVRPPVVYGPRSKILRLFKWLQNGFFPFIGSMDNWMHPSYIENLIDGIILAAEKSIANGEVYIIGDEKPVRWNEYINYIAEAIGVKPPTIHVPVWLVKIVAGLSELKSWMFGTEPFLTRYWIHELTKNFAYDISKAKRDLGYYPKISLKEGIRRTVKWYRDKNILK